MAAHIVHMKVRGACRLSHPIKQRRLTLYPSGALRSGMMKTTEIRPLTQQNLSRLIAGREARAPKMESNGRRKVKRWPFPGTAELWITERDGTERYVLATSLNLSMEGAGIRCDEPLSPGMKLSIAMHEPEVSLHGLAVVRHCTAMDNEYLVGLEFCFAACP